MDSQDLKIAKRIGETIAHFSEEWSEYQDWLRDIISSRLILRQRYSAWQAAVIFRWRLLYFAVYIGKIIVVNRLSKKLKSFLSKKEFTNFTTFATRAITAIESLQLARHRYLLQRTATLLAVAELTLCGIAAITGILLAFYYQPTALGAYKSLTIIVNEVSNGSLILSLHNLAGNSLIGLTLIQIVVMFLGRQFLLPWLAAWISGICFTLTTIGLSWTYNNCC